MTHDGANAVPGVGDIGARIRRARLERGFSQGDLERRTGLLRCYLSRVENGHTAPSLPTLARLAAALEMPLVAFFENPAPNGAGAAPADFLAQMRQWAPRLSEADRRRVLALAESMVDGQANAATAGN